MIFQLRLGYRDFAQLTYAEAIRAAQANKVAKVTITETLIDGEYIHPEDGKNFFIANRVDPVAAAVFEKAGVEVAGATDSNWLTTLISWTAPIIDQQRFSQVAGGGDMTMFEDRERAAEIGFVLQTERLFRVHAKRDKMIAVWAAHLLGCNAKTYADEIVETDLLQGERGIVSKLEKDLDILKIADLRNVILKQMDACLEKAIIEFPL